MRWPINGCENLSLVRIRKVKFATKNIKSKFIACDFSVRRVVTFCVVLHRNQRLVNCIVHFAELHIGSSIGYKILWLEIIFSNVIKSKKLNKIILQLFSEYTLVGEERAIFSAIDYL